MSWFTDLFKRRQAVGRSPVIVAKDGMVIRRSRWIGDYAVTEYHNGRVVVQFDSQCDCLITIVCVSWAAAIYLATAMENVVTACTVDVQLDKVLT